MRRPVKTIMTLAVALILASSIAYAAEKKKQAKVPAHAPETSTSEEEALKAELLGEMGDYQERLSGIDTAASKNIEKVRSETRKEG